MGSVGPPAAGRAFFREKSDDSLIRQSFKPQIEGLLQGGADLILLETQVDPMDTLTLYNLTRELSADIPVSVSFTFGHDLLTPSGFSMEDIADVFRDTDIVMLGANHGTGPLQCLDIHRRLSMISPFPILLKPNSGVGKYRDGRFIFPGNPEHFCRCMLSCADGRAGLLGGCCGTTPEFVRMLAAGLDQEASEVFYGSPGIPQEKQEDDGKAEYIPPGLSSRLAARDALVMEMLPPRGGDLSKFAERVERLRRYAPVTVSIPDSPMGRVRMSPCISGLFIKEKLGIEPLVHFALRDRSLTRVQSDLLAMSGSGLQSVFLISGDPPSLGDYPESTAVYDLSTEQTLTLLSNLAMGRDLNGRRIGSAAGLFPGSALSLGEDGVGEKLERRWAAGCRFFITQPVYSMNVLQDCSRLLEEYPVIPCLMPLKSRYSAEYLAAEVPGISIPDEIMGRIRNIKDEDVMAYSLEHLKGLMESMRGLASGVYLAGPPVGTMELAESWRRMN
jgi:homocysteine S-methyltransferase